MKITIDGKKRKFELPEADNFGALLEVIYEKIRKEGRLVNRILIDGEEISPEKEEALGPSQLSGFKQLEIVTSSKREVAKESIRDSLAFIDHIVKEFRDLVKGLREGNVDVLGERMMGCLQDLSDFVELFSTIKQMSPVDTRQIIIDGKRVDDLETLMLAAIKETISTDQKEGVHHTINSIEMILIPVLNLFKRCITEIDSTMGRKG